MYYTHLIALSQLLSAAGWTFVLHRFVALQLDLRTEEQKVEEERAQHSSELVEKEMLRTLKNRFLSQNSASSTRKTMLRMKKQLWCRSMVKMQVMCELWWMCCEGIEVVRWLREMAGIAVELLQSEGPNKASQKAIRATSTQLITADRESEEKKKGEKTILTVETIADVVPNFGSYKRNNTFIQCIGEHEIQVLDINSIVSANLIQKNQDQIHALTVTISVNV